MKRVFGIKELFKLILEYWKEYQYPKDWKKYGWKSYNRFEFGFRLFLGWLLAIRCHYCDADGLSGYYEREACLHCDGFTIDWKELFIKRWNNFWRDKNWESRSYYEFQKYNEVDPKSR